MSDVATDVPARAEGLQLIGEMKGSGYKRPPALVRRADGQSLHLTPLLYVVLSEIDGERDLVAVAARASARTGMPVSADNVATLVDEQLRPMGLLLRDDGSAPELKRSNPLLGLRMRVSVTDPERTRQLTDPFRILFHPVAWVPLLLIFVGVVGWLLFSEGLASATYQAFQRPGLLLLVLLVTVLSAGFHEFGHSAAARRAGAQPGVMGAGIYLVWPAFYTDVTDSYRLGRRGRILTDLGGLYFNAIVAVAIMGIWSATRWDALLLVVVTQILQMIKQLTPLVRFDGYHVLADLTGVPDLFPRIWPTLRSLVFWGDPKAAELKLWARAVITLWVLVVVPLLAIAVIAMLTGLPRLLGTAFAATGREWSQTQAAFGAGELIKGTESVVSLVLVVFPVLAIGVLLSRLFWQVGRMVLRSTEGRPVRRTVAGALALAAVSGLAWAWWPQAETYRPVLPFEGGTISQAVATPLSRVGIPVSAASTASSRLEGGRAETVLRADSPLPREDSPVPALILIPRITEGSDLGGDGSEVAPDAPTWVFPFDRPLPPDAGDNQAIAVNTQDGSVVYDVAMGMVWAEDDQVLNTNESFAFASCQDCVTVSVAFQVVAIVGDANVVVPQNTSAAVNYECFDCITASVAKQLVVTVDDTPTREQQLAMVDVWDDLRVFAASIPSLSLSEILEGLDGYQTRIAEVLGIDLSVLQGNSETDDQPTPSPSPSPSSNASSSPSPSSSRSAEPSGSASPSPSASTSPRPEPSTTSSPKPAPSPSATRSPSPSSEPVSRPASGSSSSPSPAASSSAPSGNSSAP